MRARSLALGLLILTGLAARSIMAQTDFVPVEVAPYLPLATGNLWTREGPEGFATTIVQPGPVDIGGTLGWQILEVSGPNAGLSEFRSNDPNGIRAHRVTGFIQGEFLTVEFLPPLRLLHAFISPGDEIDQRGVVERTLVGSTLELLYTSHTSVEAIGRVDTPAGIFCDAIVVRSILTLTDSPEPAATTLTSRDLEVYVRDLGLAYSETINEQSGLAPEFSSERLVGSSLPFPPLDSDCDGVLDDGDASGDPADTPCDGPDDIFCDDNCGRAQNPDQLDSGGIDTEQPDGIGDACQCGDVGDNGRLDILDAVLLARSVQDLLPALPAPEKCRLTLHGRCDGIDRAALRSLLAGRPTQVGPFCPATLPPGVSVDLNGVDEYLADDFPTSNWGLGATATLAAWSRVRGDGSGPGGAGVVFEASQPGPVPNRFQWLLVADGGPGGGRWQVQVSNAVPTIASLEGPVVQLGVWTHVAIVKDGIASLTLYVDGEEVDRVLNVLATEVVPRVGAIGARSFQGHGSPFNGAIHSVSIWENALDADEIRELATRGRTIDPGHDSGAYASSAQLIHRWQPGGDITDIGRDFARSRPIDIDVDAAHVSATDDLVPAAP